MTSLLLGVDGGGTKTRALVGDLSGRVLGAGVAGTSNYQVVGLEAAMAALSQAVQGALSVAEIEPGSLVFRAACFGLAGADRPADVVALSAALAEWGTIQRLQIVNDADLLLAVAAVRGPAVALISGTGSICVGRDAAGCRARAGGWGHLLGDEGSGYELALRALRLTTQTADGRARAHAVSRAVLAKWGLAAPEDLIPFAYQRGTTRAQLSELAWTILQLAQDGDPDARALLAASAVDLARQVDAVCTRLQLDRPVLAMGGGLLLGSPLLRELVRGALTVGVSETVVVDDPTQGALRLAAALLDETTGMAGRG